MAPYHGGVQPPAHGDDWLGLTAEPLPVDTAASWAVRPECGAVVSFVGTVRDHAEGRAGVTSLTYEAYATQVEPRLAAIASEARVRFDEVGRIALLHRTGLLELTEPSVVVVVSAGHRGPAFSAARYCIDTLKATVPIWKKESWAGGDDWGTGAHDVEAVRSEWS